MSRRHPRDGVPPVVALGGLAVLAVVAVVLLALAVTRY